MILPKSVGSGSAKSRPTPAADVDSVRSKPRKDALLINRINPLTQIGEQ